jgi:methylmalonyl-CoA mutase
MKFTQERERLGGMTKAIEAGNPKLRIEEAARKQARIDSSQDIIVGVNKYRLRKGRPLQILMSITKSAQQLNKVRPHQIDERL